MQVGKHTGKKLNIAMMVRGYIPVPRPADMIYAPIDLAETIAKGLAAKGHKVDFYAPTGSHVPGVTIRSLNLRPLVTNDEQFRAVVNDTSLKGRIQPNLWDNQLAHEMFVRAQEGEYDLLYFHHTEIAMPFARDSPLTPVVYTMHDPIYPWYRELFEMYASPNQRFVSISNNQRRDATDLSYAKTIYNGVDLDKFTFSAEAEDYLLFVGRIVPEKGVKEAVELARDTGERLLIIGPVYPEAQGYFDQYVKPFLSGHILFLGPMEQDQLVRYYQKAKALITPVQWEEPFGLTTIEAMACGTPCISLRRGAAPELIVSGKTGFLVRSMAAMASALRKLDTIDRTECHRHVEEHFSNARMVDEYEEVFQKVATSNRFGRFQRKVAGTARKAVHPTRPLPATKQINKLLGSKE